MSLAERVVLKWRAVGVSRDDVEELAAAPSAIEALAQAHALVLPAPFRELWTLSDGTAAMDDDELTFWPLDNITSDPSLAPHRQQLVFADWRLQSRCFGLAFEEGRAGAVVSETGKLVASSFEDFLERYLTEPRSLVPAAR